jgi:hypothetical protein
MNLADIRSAEWRARALARVSKRILGIARARAGKSPVLIAGMQRSGTTMLMNIFHLHPDTEVHDEAPRSRVFLDFRVRSMDVLHRSINASRYPFPCYKIISDSHILPRFLKEFQSARVIWMYREPGPNAESRLKKWPHATAAIRLVADAQPGGGWFAEGVSESVRHRLRALDTPRFTDFDWACLAWWVRNQLYLELQLPTETRVKLLRYETLSTNPAETMRRLFEWLGMDWSPPSMRFVHARSLRKPNLPAMNGQVKDLCDDLLSRLDQIHARHWQL